jgi:hypothetical protein
MSGVASGAFRRGVTRGVILVAFAILVIGPVVAQPAGAPVLKSFRDWEVGCDNTGGCVAIAFAREDAPSTYVRLVLPAGPGAGPALKLVVDGEEIGNPRLTAPAGQGGAVASAFLAAARRAGRATFSGAGGVRADISLAGASAALLLIDEIQGRLGAVSAYARPGARPDSAVPPPGRPPAVRPVPTAGFGAADAKIAASLASAVRARLNADCSRPADSSAAGEAWAMGEGRTLVALPCDSAAYNFSQRYWLVRGAVAGAQPLAFADPLGVAMDALVNADYAPDAGLLSFFSKGRGPGDCGVAGKYAWTGAGFALAEMTRLDQCRGVAPEDWPTLWRTAP